jgi:hypothetical protein
MSNLRRALDEDDQDIPRANEVYPSALLPPRREAQIVYQDNPNAIQRHNDGTMTYKRFTLTAIGMAIPDDVSGDEWNDVGTVIKSLESSISWVVGDWAEYANRVWKVSYAEMAKHFGYEEETLWAYASVCRSVPTLIRNQGVYFGHGRLVAPLYKTPDLQFAWLQYAAALHLRVKDLKDEMGLLSVMPVEAAIGCLEQAINEQKRLVEYDQFKPKPKSKKANPEKERVIAFRSYVDSAIDKIPYMDREARAAFIERTEWLANYYAKLTEQAKTVRNK